MADFCLQCSVDLGAPEGWSDFAEMPPGVWAVICEGCCEPGAYVVVEVPPGRCIGPCSEGHQDELKEIE